PLADAEREARDAVIQRRGGDSERRRLDEALRRGVLGRHRLERESRARPESGPVEMVLVALDDVQLERVARGEIPRVAGELAANVVDQAGGPAERELAITR